MNEIKERCIGVCDSCKQLKEVLVLFDKSKYCFDCYEK